MANALGKGLSALMGDQENEQITAANEAVAEGVKTIPIAAISAWDGQPRQHFAEEELQELCDSIRENGVIQPIIVRAKAGQQAQYEIIAGERRWRASQRAGIAEIPAIVMEADDTRALEIALIENIQRHDLNPLETAQAFQQLMDKYHYTQEQLAKTLGKSRSQIANTVRLLQLDDITRELLNSGKLTFGHARALIGCVGAADIAQKVVKQQLNVRQTERLVQRASGDSLRKRNEKPGAEKFTKHKVLSKELSDLGTCDVEVQHGSFGSVKISIASDATADHDSLLAALRGALSQ